MLAQEVDGINELEVAYRINDQYWGNGYATEATKSCMDLSQDFLRATSIISIILPENRSSVRVAEKNGLIVEKESLFHAYQVQIYRKVF
ncbi:MAG: ribosomal-protein-alanine N-acetyltransferase [Chitinophagales bacterium]